MNEDEEKKELLEQYTRHDNPECPGWLLLTSQVLNRYGTCPYLNTSKSDDLLRRIRWIQDQSDRGKFMYEKFSEYTIDKPRQLQEFKNQLQELSEQLSKTVKETLCPQDKRILEELLIVLEKRCNVKGMNKKFKNEWNTALEKIDDLSNRYSFDFFKYTRICYNLYIRRNCMVKDTCIISELISDHQKLESKIHSMTVSLDNDKQDAFDRLYILIKANFEMEQIGKYFKRWSGLTSEKKLERITSYCQWYLRKNVNVSDSLEEMIQFVQKSLSSKDLKVSDVIWNSKFGIITNIQLQYNSDSGFSVKVSEPTRRKIINQQTVSSVIDNERINRLILYEIVKGNGYVNKSNVLDSVLDNVYMKQVKRDVLCKYIQQQYDVILQIVVNNPIILE
jgi:hypothetical protein